MLWLFRPLAALACGEADTEPPVPRSGGIRHFKLMPQTEASRQQMWAQWLSLEERARQVTLLAATDRTAGDELQSRLIDKERREFRRQCGLSRQAFDALLAEGAAKDWIHSSLCHVDQDTVYRVGFHGLAPATMEPITGRYPPGACQSGIHGVVILELIVGAGGVRQAEVLKGLSPELDASAVSAARQAVWLPPLVCGEPATVAWLVTVNYRLPADCAG